MGLFWAEPFKRSCAISQLPLPVSQAWGHVWSWWSHGTEAAWRLSRTVRRKAPAGSLGPTLQLLHYCRTNFMVSGYWYLGVFGRSSIAKDNPKPSDPLGGASQAGNHLAWGVSRDPGGGESTQLRHTESPLHHGRKFSATFYDKLLSENVIKINRSVPKLIPYIFPTLLLRS